MEIPVNEPNQASVSDITIRPHDDDNVITYTQVQTTMESNRKAMNRNWSNQKANPALKTKAGNK